MPGPTPPNPDLADLANLLGVDNVRILVRTFLREYPLMLVEMKTGDRKTQHRIAHSLKSNSRVVGARDLSARMAALEARLASEDEPDLTARECAEIEREFQVVGHSLREFVEST